MDDQSEVLDEAESFEPISANTAMGIVFIQRLSLLQEAANKS